ATIQGVQFDSAVVAKVISVDPVEIEEALERIEKAHALVRSVREHEMPDGTPSCQYRFQHALYQNAIYATIRLTRRVALSSATADALSELWLDRKAEIASDLARLYEDARKLLLAAQYYLLAARNSAALFAYREAARLAQRGLDLVKTLPDSLETHKL